MELNEHYFKKFREFIYETSAINLSDKKRALVQSRLSKRINQLKMKSFSEYYKYVTDDSNSEEISIMMDFISTNVTSFFREAPHWEYLRNNMSDLKHIIEQRGKLRIWSAACSSGQEPYTIAMFMKDECKIARRNEDVKILATDISNQILREASRGEYASKDMTGLSKMQLKHYFSKMDKGENEYFSVSHELKNMITFRQFNLTRGNYSIFANKKFDIIFCRNVMIYFDTPTKHKLIEQYYRLLSPGGLLFLGHSESIPRTLYTKFKAVQPSIYKKI